MLPNAEVGVLAKGVGTSSNWSSCNLAAALEGVVGMEEYPSAKTSAAAAVGEVGVMFKDFSNCISSPIKSRFGAITSRCVLTNVYA